MNTSQDLPFLKNRGTLKGIVAAEVISMNVKSIIHTKGNKVHTVQKTQKINDAIEVLNTHNIGVVVVVDEDNKISGILSERDIIRKMEDHTASIYVASVSSCMTADPVTCSFDASIDEVMDIMTRRKIRHLPVVDDGQLAGLISIGDVVKRKIEQTEKDAASLRDYIAG